MENNRQNPININWFPGHMTKAKRGMQEKLKLVDMVIELRDARIPNASKNPLIDELINQKPRLIILTKIDKAESKQTERWVTSLSDENTQVLCLNVLKDNVTKKVVGACQILMKEKIDRQIRKGMKPRAIRAMVCGIPNVGKSTLINQLAKKKATITGDRPGVTKALQWVKVGDTIELLDTPGVLWPKFEDEQVGLVLAVTGAINDQILPLEEVAYFALKYLKQGYAEQLASYYGVELIENNYKLFQNIGKKRGYMSKGNEVDMKRVIDSFLRDIRSDKFGAITWEKVDEM
ncbi:MAG: ribosome biogenesis GTPase YlqF [Erysipelotrichia bacterium]|nr:ribosome biogenesis GTPase YlqF [Erysipelotrichia bacterium]NCC54241.1 ribosome biogenesis GTPase YlqF [Erysipelotrichia bacterium]